MSDDENQPPPPPLPPEPPETRMEASIRNAMEAIERLAAIQASQLVTSGSTPRDTQSVVEIVRESKDPMVIKSLNDNNYTVLETGWIGDSRHYHHTDSRHHNRGFIPIDHLPDNNEFEIRLKARHLIEFHRTRGRNNGRRDSPPGGRLRSHVRAALAPRTTGLPTPTPTSPRYFVF